MACIGYHVMAGCNIQVLGGSNHIFHDSINNYFGFARIAIGLLGEQ